MPAITVAAILSAAGGTAVVWVRDQRAAVVAVVILALPVGIPALAALGKALGDEFIPWK